MSRVTVVTGQPSVKCEARNASAPPRTRADGLAELRAATVSAS